MKAQIVGFQRFVLSDSFNVSSGLGIQVSSKLKAQKVIFENKLKFNRVIPASL